MIPVEKLIITVPSHGRDPIASGFCFAVLAAVRSQARIHGIEGVVEYKAHESDYTRDVHVETFCGPAETMANVTADLKSRFGFDPKDICFTTTVKHYLEENDEHKD